MVDGAAFALFLSGALLLNITPGPDMAFTLASTARGGTRAGFAAALGIGAGSLGWAFATAAGLAAMLAASEHALTVIRIAGGLYLLYLAARTLMEKSAPLKAEGAAGALQSFRSGALTNLFNPKVGLFYLAFLPSFANPEAGPVALQILLLGAIFSVTGTLVLFIVAAAAGALRGVFAASRSVQGVTKAISASVFGGLGAYLLFSERPGA
ncbi:LysE family translocator [Hyphococcus sp.]|jgi:threonine/homoserine/homoserine lactone efflux protein|uniref:LysE family translocator n=1 Tax=Hyphococcus sp. TaxID=2038636 RepID=UPI003D0FC589